ncbi:hypothetical protein JQ629_01025 [Bradyrhizobium sp. AUGA SZCCT0222]|uniref:hypothetical protein n=1 Tax=Bradyrhizobium sp. AUGA SZCCT0222 TaxID=2807668 RepID=UPI001BADF537|nr:hypothetical protein [Bradyrhizobium sp. AUGA SZCCT0222]MBR1266086.1 hypothetical protein [Bradyrhizobium sp. AUGA SZCCT0222]
MRQAIETAPRDGKVVILEDDASGSYDTAHWSRKTYQWVAENGEPSKITPTHWYPRPRDKYLLREDDRSPRRFVAGSIIASLIAMAIVGVYFRSEVAGYVTQDAGRQGVFGINRLQVERDTKSPADLLAVQEQAEADQARASAGAQVKQAGKAFAPEARQSLEQEQPTDSLTNELAETRRTVDRLTLQLRAEIANSAQALGEERGKAAALAQQVDTVRRELTASSVQYRQTLDEERARGAALASELATAQREIETQAAQLRKAGDEAAQVKRTAEHAMAELRQSLQQERERAAAMARDLESARRTSNVRVKPEPAAISQTPEAAQAEETASIARPAAVETQAQGSPDPIRLIALAKALLGQGDIGAARVVLERAAETGSAQASFMLAETYDPAILSGWGTYGTRGEVTKAREFYAKARAGGIQEAKDRFNALRQ